MLVIRHAQLAAFEAEFRKKFVPAAAEYIRRCEPQLAGQWSEEEYVERVAAALERAAHYGIADVFAIASFFAAMSLHGAAFDSHPAVAAILNDQDLHPDHRIHAMWSRIPKETWEEIAREKNDGHSRE